MQHWLSAMFGVSYLGLGSLVPFLALVLQQRGIDGVMLTAALGALPLSRLVFGPLWSVLADRFQAPTRMVRIGGGLSAVGALLLWQFLQAGGSSSPCSFWPSGARPQVRSLTVSR